jgi:hypothetical protein
MVQLPVLHPSFTICVPFLCWSPPPNAPKVFLSLLLPFALPVSSPLIPGVIMTIRLTHPI